MTDETLPRTLIEAVRYFSDLAVCHRYMRRIRWPDGKIVCPKCGAKGDRIGEIKTLGIPRCKDCRLKIYPYKGTIFEDSKIKLDKWLPAVWSVANCKNGISSHELARAFGVTQKTAWFMAMRIREAMRTGTFQRLKGEVEGDETFIGGESRNMHKSRRERKIRGRGSVGKAIVQGVLERGGEVRCEVVRSTEGSELVPTVARNVEFSATVYTDAHGGYADLWRRFAHHVIDHAREYVRGRVHTNGLENFWSLVKRCIKGTYIKLAPFHLSRYLDEQSFRFNQRTTSDAGRFQRAMEGVVGRRLTWRFLTAQSDCGFMGIE